MDRYFYQIEQDVNGNKCVHISGNIYYNDADGTNECFRHAIWVGMYISIEELKEFLENDDFFDYINERVVYLDNLTEEEAIEACQVYFDGEPGKWLNIKHVNEDAPCGDYWFE